MKEGIRMDTSMEISKGNQNQQSVEKVERKHRIELPNYTLGEELVSAISHGVGAALGIVALVLCVIKAAGSGSALAVVSSAIFGASLVLLYLMSTIYHALKPNQAKRVFRVFDHCTIFLLIAGTYIPIVLVSIGGVVGWVYFGIVVVSSILGIIFNAIDVEKFKVFSMTSYIGIGWVIVFGFNALRASMDTTGIILLVAGGVTYTVGAIVYGVGGKVKYLHSVWHFFVLGGSILHFLVIYNHTL